jgi:hypothetical protein
MGKRADGILIIRVVRTGGFAGLRREWLAEAHGDDRDEWMPLIQACPWQRVAPPDTRSRDRFTWRIEVDASRLRRTATLPDAALDGPWRDLVQRVQRAATPEAPA